MDLRAFYFQAAEAAATVATEEDDDVTTPKLSPSAAVRQEGRTSGGASPVAVGVHSDAMSCEGSGGARDLICPECGKAFLSDKAMYGHLRCHPGRRNKGAIRPATPVASASSVIRGDAKARKVLWMEDDLPTKWPLTAKRGRTPTVATSVSVSVQPVSVLESTYSAEEEAANTLLDLSQQARNAVAEQQMQMMPRADQLELPADRVADPVAPEPEQPVIPDMADALQHVEQAEMRAPVEQAEMRAPVKQAEMRAPVEQAEMRSPVKQAEMRAPVEQAEMRVPVKQAEMRAPVEHIFGIILQPQAPGIEPSNFIAASEPVNNSAPVVVRDEDKSISPGVKKLKKRRLHDPVSQSPDSSQPPQDPEDVRPPVRRIPSPASDRRYACPSCYKSFPTHQALGGHMASHNRAIRCAAAQQVDGLAVAQAVQNILAHRQRQDSANASSSGLGEDLRISLRPPKPVSHTCVRCRQIFSTGQALGGHMRKHFLEDRLQAAAAAAAPATAPPALAAAAVALAIAPAAVPEAQNGAPRDFDLNEMMPWE